MVSVAGMVKIACKESWEASSDDVYAVVTSRRAVAGRLQSWRVRERLLKTIHVQISDQT